MIKLSKEETIIAEEFLRIKEDSGSHSPSVLTLKKMLSGIDIKVDACFLSNPYATDLFLKYLESDLIENRLIRDVLEFYPSQNDIIASAIAKSIKVNKENIFVGNGAIEIIQVVMKNLVRDNVVIILPTFSSYYEFVNQNTKCLFYNLQKDNDFLLDIDDYISFVKSNKAKSIVLINPNNPNGNYIKYEEMIRLLEEFRYLDNIIVDESFIHFAYEDNQYSLKSVADFIERYSNLIVIKSMSKDFGIAGVRAGYAIMGEQTVRSLTKDGFLWNSNGIAEYFFSVYSNSGFLKEYEIVRKRYIIETHDFIKRMNHIKNIKVYPSMANFILIELLDGSTAADFVMKLLIKYGIYTRIGNDKIGLDGEFIRIASRKFEENLYIYECVKELMEEN